MTDLRTAAQQALEALHEIAWSNDTRWQSDRAATVIPALRAALEQPEPTPDTDCHTQGICQRSGYGITQQAEPVAVDVDALAQHIRFVDGNHNLGAGILAEKIVEFLIKLGIGKEQAEPVQEPYCHVYEYDSVFGLHRELYPREYNGRKPDRAVPLYTAPPQRKPLTEEEILSVLRLAPPEPSLWPHVKDEAVVGDVKRAVLAIARAIESKLQEKNT